MLKSILFQYVNLFNTNFYDYQVDYQQEMQRPPLKATFTSNNWTFTLYTIHTQPDNVSGELNILETIVGGRRNLYKPLGDPVPRIC